MYPIFSVIVPCYNCLGTLIRCFESIMNQTESSFELILVDDGSLDGTEKLCEKLAKLDERVRIIHQENSGPMRAWKQGIKKARGSYIVSIDADDFIDSDMLEKINVYVSKQSYDLVIFGNLIVYEDGKILYNDNLLEEGIYNRESIKKNILPIFFSNGKEESQIIDSSRCNKVFRREFLLEVMPYMDERLRNGEDRLAVFVSVLNAESLYCIKGFYPYHYLRNSKSCVGRYDPQLFLKMCLSRETLIQTAKIFEYTYLENIEYAFLSTILVVAKKEICRNPIINIKTIKEHLSKMREHEYVQKAYLECDLNGFSLPYKLFAMLLKYRMYTILIIMSKTLSFVGMGVQ